ncbi:MAG: hypothetical protein ABIE55_03270 [Candidatus Aenigmatarchaeota archaeon]
MAVSELFLDLLPQLSPYATLAALSLTSAAFTSGLFRNRGKYPIFNKVSNDFLVAFFSFTIGILFTSANSLFPNNDIIGAGMIFSLFIGILFLSFSAWNLLKVY